MKHPYQFKVESLDQVFSRHLPNSREKRHLSWVGGYFVEGVQSPAYLKVLTDNLFDEKVIGKILNNIGFNYKVMENFQTYHIPRDGATFFYGDKGIIGKAFIELEKSILDSISKNLIDELLKINSTSIAMWNFEDKSIIRVCHYKLKIPTIIKKMPLFIIQDDQIKFGTKKVNNLDNQGQTILNNLIAP